jgi:hypothetical protein
VIEGIGWCKRPMKITIDDATEVDPGLLLFAAFLVATLTHTARPAAPTAA